MRNRLAREEVMAYLRSHAKEFKDRYTAEKIGVFGSIARGSASPESDIDVLVVFSNPTFDHYMDLKFLLEDHFQRKVDLVEQQTLKPRIKEIVTREAVYA